MKTTTGVIVGVFLTGAIVVAVVIVLSNRNKGGGKGAPPPAPSGGNADKKWAKVQSMHFGMQNQHLDQLLMASFKDCADADTCMGLCQSAKAFFGNYDKDALLCQCYSEGSTADVQCLSDGLGSKKFWALAEVDNMPTATCPPEGVQLSDCHNGGRNNGMRGYPDPDDAKLFFPPSSQISNSAECASACWETPGKETDAAIFTTGTDSKPCACYTGFNGTPACWSSGIPADATLDLWLNDSNQDVCERGSVREC